VNAAKFRFLRRWQSDGRLDFEKAKGPVGGLNFLVGVRGFEPVASAFGEQL
jgi:hypothetical protein